MRTTTLLSIIGVTLLSAMAPRIGIAQDLQRDLQRLDAMRRARPAADPQVDQAVQRRLLRRLEFMRRAQVEAIQVGGPVTTEARRRQQYLDELVVAISKACHLSAGQRKRLQVASKGAVEYSLKSAPQQTTAAQIQVKRAVAMVIQDRLGGAAEAANHPLWRNTLERMLNADQLEQVARLEKQQQDKWSQQYKLQQIDGARRGQVEFFNFRR